jgi:Zinc-finger associated domain (zf-AD)
MCPKMRTKPPKICTLHFTEESVYYNKKTQTVSLKAAAVPSIYYKENQATVVEVETAPVASIPQPTGSLCRICLNIGDHLMAPIFEVNDLHSMIHIVTDVKMVQNDGFPSMICTGCVEKVLAAYKLRVQTKQTDEILRDILKVTQPGGDSEAEASRDEGIVVDNDQNG